MKRAVLCVPDPQNYIASLSDYSIMIINPDSTESRLKYLLDNSDYSLLITPTDEQVRDGGDYGDEKVLWYTSGTTGDSKFRSFTQRQIDIQAKNICECYGITSNDRFLSIMPLWHSHGQGLYWAMQHAGCEVEYITYKDLADTIKFDPTFISAIPDFLKVFLKQKFASLRFVRSASSPLPDSLYNKLKDWSQSPVIEAFGMTEALSHCFTNPLYGEQRIGTVGLPSGIDAKIEDGQLHIQGPCIFTTGWFNTQDLVEQDSAGYYKIVGRAVDTINIRGIKYNPNSIEQQLHTKIKKLEQCVIFGKTKIKCLYVGDIDKQIILRILLDINQNCRPVVLEQVEKIPVNNVGKISRSYLDILY